MTSEANKLQQDLAKFQEENAEALGIIDTLTDRNTETTKVNTAAVEDNSDARKEAAKTMDDFEKAVRKLRAELLKDADEALIDEAEFIRSSTEAAEKAARELQVAFANELAGGLTSLELDLRLAPRAVSYTHLTLPTICSV